MNTRVRHYQQSVAISYCGYRRNSFIFLVERK